MSLERPLAPAHDRGPVAAAVRAEPVVGPVDPPAGRSGRAPLPRGLRLARALVAAAVVAGALVLGRSSGVLVGVTGLLVAALLVLLVPTSRDLSRRVLLAGCLLLGWTPLLWWWPLPVAGAGRVTIVLAVVGGALAAWVGAGARPAARARHLVPRLRAVDLLVPVAVGVAAVVLAPWLRAKSAVQTLGMLLSGYDNSAHFSMVHMIRRYGVTVDALGAPPGGSTWQFDSYPQGFHAVIATIIELVAGPVPGGIGAELTSYSRAVALFVLAVVALLVAGFCALPVLRGRPGRAAPVAAFVTAVLLFGPGAHAIQGGIGNFTQACVLVVAIPLVGVPLTRVWSPLPLAALGGAVVGVASSWVLLLALAAPALLVVLLPLRRRRWSAPPARIVASIVIALAVVGCLVRIAVVLSRVQAASPLTLTGGSVPLNLGLAVAAALGTVGACLLLRRAPGPDHPGSGRRARVVALAGVPVAGVLAAVALAVVQIRANGSISYYGFKFMIGLEIVLLLLLVVPVVHLLGRRGVPAPDVRSRVRGFVGSAAVALALTQVFGLTGPDRTQLGLPPGAEGAKNRAQQLQVLLDPPSTADLVDLVDRADRPVPPATFYLDMPSDGRVDPILAAQWFLSLTDTWTAAANATAVTIGLDGTDARATAVAGQILRSRPDATVAVPEAYRARLQTALGSPGLAARVIGL